MFDSIPASYRETARSALAATFGATPCTGLQPVGGGASGALTYRIEVAGRPYLLRLETARDPFRNPHRSYVCMRAAADAGIAPALHHADPTAGVVIMDFLPQRPLTDYPGGAPALARDLGALVARLQATPTFPRLTDYPPIVEIMLAQLRASGRFAPGLLDPHAAGLERIRQAYPWDGAALVSSHNDANAGNILFDGQRLWLIDWEIAFRNDPLVDIAILAGGFAATPELEEVLLQAWLGRAPDRLLRARLVLMRQLTRLFYGCLTLGMLPPGAPLETDLTAISIAELRAAFAAGRLKVGTPEALRVMGKSILAGFLAGLAAPGFEEALAVVRQG